MGPQSEVKFLYKIIYREKSFKEFSSQKPIQRSQRGVVLNISIGIYQANTLKICFWKIRAEELNLVQVQVLQIKVC